MEGSYGKLLNCHAAEGIAVEKIYVSKENYDYELSNGEIQMLSKALLINDLL